MKCNSMNEAVKKCLENYPMDYEFGLWDLKSDVFKLYPPSEDNHADTVSRRLREYWLGDDFGILCIKPNVSGYKKVHIDIIKKLEKRFKSINKFPPNRLELAQFYKDEYKRAA